MIEYLTRTRAYYQRLGYPAYRWACSEAVPFCRPAKPPTEARLGLITTAAPHRAELGDQGPGAPYNAAAKFYTVYTVPTTPTPDLRISHLGYDRTHSSAADPNSFLPIAALRSAVRDGSLGSLAEQVIGVPTNRSQRVTRTQDAQATLRHAQELELDLALLVPT